MGDNIEILGTSAIQLHLSKIVVVVMVVATVVGMVEVVTEEVEMGAVEMEVAEKVVEKEGAYCPVCMALWEEDDADMLG